MILTKDSDKIYFECSSCQTSQPWPPHPWKSVRDHDLVECQKCQTKLEAISLAGDHLVVAQLREPQEMLLRKK